MSLTCRITPSTSLKKRLKPKSSHSWTRCRSQCSTTLTALLHNASFLQKNGTRQPPAVPDSLMPRYTDCKANMLEDKAPQAHRAGKGGVSAKFSKIVRTRPTGMTQAEARQVGGQTAFATVLHSLRSLSCVPVLACVLVASCSRTSADLVLFYGLVWV